jgi:hypothetical protein
VLLSLPWSLINVVIDSNDIFFFKYIDIYYHHFSLPVSLLFLFHPHSLHDHLLLWYIKFYFYIITIIIIPSSSFVYYFFHFKNKVLCTDLTTFYSHDYFSFDYTPAIALDFFLYQTTNFYFFKILFFLKNYLLKKTKVKNIKKLYKKIRQHVLTLLAWTWDNPA